VFAGFAELRITTAKPLKTVSEAQVTQQTN
jgi:hypothetical protein